MQNLLIQATAILIVVTSLLFMASSESTENISETGRGVDKIILIKGGQFDMGDQFGEGAEDERPVHQVTLSDFYLNQYEVTVAEFREFVENTGYETSAEGPDDKGAQDEILRQIRSPDLTDEDRQRLHQEYLNYRGTAYWDAEARKWSGYRSDINWKQPGIEQSDSHPVLGISPDDAMHYCNWLSEREGLPIAYDLDTGGILDSHGNPTSDITEVVGHRLPTEAEWEYAAREGGRQVRFGNGKDIARSSEINFRGDDGDYDYLNSGSYTGMTTPVGSYSPNASGLYDMSGNAWEWVSDNYAEYSPGPQVNPYITSGRMHSARGGRWGGDAFEARVSHRDPYPHNDRCNNTGFRLARSVN